MSGIHTISVRVKKETVQGLKDITSKYPTLSQANVIERCIEYLNQLPESTKHSILHGNDIDFLSLLGSSIHLLAWGEHAFRRGWITWAIESFALLEQTEKGNGDVKRIAWFKLGSLWIDFAAQLRTEARRSATHEQWLLHYVDAIECLYVSAAYHRAFNENLQAEKIKDKNADSCPNLAVLYNEVCSWTLIGQYAYECDKEFATTSQESLLAEETTLKSNELSGYELKTDEVPSESIRACQNALRLLEGIEPRKPSTMEAGAFSDVSWLIRYAPEDPELQFLRRLNKSDFTRIVKDKEMKVDLREVFARLRSGVSQEVGMLIVKRKEMRSSL